METNQTSIQEAKEIRPALPSFGKLLGYSFSFYKDHLPTLAAIAGVPFVVGLLGIFLKNVGAVVVIGLISFIIVFLSKLALISAVVDESNSAKNSFVKSVGLLGPFVGLAALQILIIWGGTTLFIVPGIIFSILLSMTAYAFFAENLRSYDALLASWHYVKNYWWPIVGRIVLLGILVLLFTWIVLLLGGFRPMPPAGEEVPLLAQILNLILGNLLIQPISIIFTYGIYRALREIKVVPPLDDEQVRMKKVLRILFWIGLVSIIVTILASGVFIAKFLPLLAK